MIKNIICPCLFSLIMMALLQINCFSLKVDVTEINVNKKIDFINYTGKHNRVYTLKEQRNIGINLAFGSQDLSKPFYSYMNYTILHAVDTNATNGYDADIFIINKNAEIDHIRAIWNILSAYLEVKYNYTNKDSMMLATFITYYNAVYRGNLDYFNSKYKQVVTKELSVNNAGLSTYYKDWPGKTKILIPLTEDLIRGNPGVLNSEELTTTKVVEELQKKEDKRTNERSAMVEFKKEEVKEKKKQIEEKKEEINKKKDQVELEEKQIEKKKEEMNNTKQELEKKESGIKKQKEDLVQIENPAEKKKKQDEITKKENQLNQDKKNVQKDEEKTKNDEKKVNEQKESIKKDQEAVQKEEQKTAVKENNIKKEEDQIKKDTVSKQINNNPEQVKEDLGQKSDQLNEKEKQLDQRESELKKNLPDKSIYGGMLYYLKIKQYMGEGHYSNEMVAINPATKKVELVSPFKNIGGHKFDVYKDGVVVIGYEQGKPSGPTALRNDNKEVVVGYTGPKPEDYLLVLLDGKTLEFKKEGKDNVYWRSFIEIRDDFIYAIVNVGGKYYLGKFDDQLEKSAQSTEELDEDTFISFYGDSIFVNSKDKQILALKKADLSLEERINP